MHLKRRNNRCSKQAEKEAREAAQKAKEEKAQNNSSVKLVFKLKTTALITTAVLLQITVDLQITIAAVHQAKAIFWRWITCQQ